MGNSKNNGRWCGTEYVELESRHMSASVCREGLVWLYKGVDSVMPVRQGCRYFQGTQNSGYLGRKQWDRGIGG